MTQVNLQTDDEISKIMNEIEELQKDMGDATGRLQKKAEAPVPSNAQSSIAATPEATHPQSAPSVSLAHKSMAEAAAFTQEVFLENQSLAQSEQSPFEVAQPAAQPVRPALAPVLAAAAHLAAAVSTATPASHLAASVPASLMMQVSGNLHFQFQYQGRSLVLRFQDQAIHLEMEQGLALKLPL